jgi:tRNA threonylcarbamoyladenosine modification (KEOPS) complex Cgi121 subunit
MTEQRKPRIYLEISGGILQQIVVDGEVEVVVVDYDNAEDPDFDADSVEDMLAETLHSGTAEEYEAEIATARTALEEIASKNADNYTP